MVSFHYAVVKIHKAHFVVVVGVGVTSSNAELQSASTVSALYNSIKLMSIERRHLISEVHIHRRIFLCNHIHRTTKRCTSELIGDNAFINLYAFYHIRRNIVQCDIVVHLPYRTLIDEHSHALAFQTTHRHARCTPHTTCVSHRHTGGSGKNIID